MTYNEFEKQVISYYEKTKGFNKRLFLILGLLCIGWCMGANCYNGLLLFGVMLIFVAAMMHYGVD